MDKILLKSGLIEGPPYQDGSGAEYTVSFGDGDIDIERHSSSVSLKAEMIPHLVEVLEKAFQESTGYSFYAWERKLNEEPTDAS